MRVTSLKLRNLESSFNIDLPTGTVVKSSNWLCDEWSTVDILAAILILMRDA